jgi:hypothetical protein
MHGGGFDEVIAAWFLAAACGLCWILGALSMVGVVKVMAALYRRRPRQLRDAARGPVLFYPRQTPEKPPEAKPGPGREGRAA